MHEFYHAGYYSYAIDSSYFLAQSSHPQHPLLKPKLMKDAPRLDPSCLPHNFWSICRCRSTNLCCFLLPGTQKHAAYYQRSQSCLCLFPEYSGLSQTHHPPEYKNRDKVCIGHKVALGRLRPLFCPHSLSMHFYTKLVPLQQWKEPPRSVLRPQQWILGQRVGGLRTPIQGGKDLCDTSHESASSSILMVKSCAFQLSHVEWIKVSSRSRTKVKLWLRRVFLGRCPHPQGLDTVPYSGNEAISSLFMFQILYIESLCDESLSKELFTSSTLAPFLATAVISLHNHWWRTVFIEPRFVPPRCLFGCFFGVFPSSIGWLAVVVSVNI